jgi:hypothetical protein
MVFSVDSTGQQYNPYARNRTVAPYRVLLLSMALSVSQALSPFPYLWAFLILAYLTMTRVGAIKHGYVVLAAAVGIAGLAGIALRYDAELAIRVVTTCALLVMLGSLNFVKQAHALNALVRFLNFSLLLCAIGFCYALAGGPHIWTVQNPDGRDALLYLTTLSNSVFPMPNGGAIIRPSFIFDEPGAYAFVIDAVLLASFMIHRRLRRQEWILLIGGMLTFSIAHMIVVLFLLIAARLLRHAIFPIVLLVVIDYWFYITIDLSLVFGRLMISEGVIVGDNRSELLKNALELLRDHPEGVGYLCNWNISACYESFGGFGDNPALPAAYYGILPALAYYLVLLYILLRSIVGLQRGALMVGLAIVALISQRPYLFNLGYNIWIVMLFCMYVQRFPLLLYRK